MRREIHRWLLVAGLALPLAMQSARYSRAADVPSAPVSNAAAESASPTTDGEKPEALPAPTVQESPPPAFVLPSPDSSLTFLPPNTALLERPGEMASPGFFANVESSVLWPSFQNEQLLGGQVTPLQLSANPPGQGVSPYSSIGLPAGAGLPITGDLVKLPHIPLNPTVSPRFELGYRLPEGFGEFRLGYRFLDTRGSQTVVVAPPNAVDNLGLASQTGRLALNIVDLDWGTREFSLGPNWQFRTAVGVRYATAFFDSQATYLNPVTVTGNPFGTGAFTRLGQSETLGNWYLGVHGVLEADRRLPVAHLSIFGRVEGAGMWGTARQTFRESFVEAPGFTEQQVVSHPATPWLNSQVGLSYEVPQWNHSRVMLGYQFEYWWSLGRGDYDLSFGALSIRGLFLRAELNF